MFDYNKQILLQLVSLNGDGLSKTDKLSEDNNNDDYNKRPPLYYEF